MHMPVHAGMCILVLQKLAIHWAVKCPFVSGNDQRSCSLPLRATGRQPSHTGWGVATSSKFSGRDRAARYRLFRLWNFFPAAFLKESGESKKHFKPASNGIKRLP
jgi:hypothetical protein